MRCMLLLPLLLLLPVLAGCTTTSATGKPAAYHYQMGVSFLEEGNYTAALVDLTEADKLDPDNAELQYNLGRALTGKRRLDLAEQRFLQALALRPNYSEARNDLGVIYLEMGRWEDAIQQFKAVKDDLFYPHHDFSVINLGLAYLGKGSLPRRWKSWKVSATAPRGIRSSRWPSAGCTLPRAILIRHWKSIAGHLKLRRTTPALISTWDWH